MSKQETLTVEQLLTNGRKPFPPLKPSALTTLTVTIPLPQRASHPNAPSHWRAKAAAKKKQREDAHLAALAALDGKAAPRWERATIHATFYRPGSRDRLSDQDNLCSWLKASVDGLQDAGVIENDRGLEWLAPSQVIGKAACGECKVVLVVTKR